MLPARLAAMRGMVGQRLRQAAVTAEAAYIRQEAASRPVSSSSGDEDIHPSGPTGAAVTAAAQQERCFSSLHAPAGSSPMQSSEATAALWRTGPQQQGQFQVPRLNPQPHNADTSSQDPAWVGCTQCHPGQLQQQPDAGAASSWAPAGHSQALDDVGTAIAWSTGGAAATVGDMREQLAETLAAMQLANKRGDHTAALDKFQPQLLRGFSRGPPCALSCDVVDAAMLACAGLGKLERAFAIAQDAAARDLPVGRVAHAALLQLLCSHGNLQGALHLLHNPIREDRPADKQIDVFAFNQVLLAALDARDLDVAQQCLDLLRARGLPWNELTWVAAFKLAALRGDDSALHELTTQLQKARPSPTMLKGHVLALCTVRQLQKAISALQGMLQHCSSSGSRGSAAQEARKACLDVMLLAVEQEEPGSALQAADLLKQAGFEADPAIEIIVHHLQPSAATPEAEANTSFSQQEVPPLQHSQQLSARIQTGLLARLIRQGDLDAASHTLQRMAATGHPKLTRSLNEWLHAAADQGNVEAAAAGFEDLQARGAAPNLASFNALFRAVRQYVQLHGRSQSPLRRGELRSQLERWLHDFKRAGIQHNVESLTSVVQTLGLLGDVDRMVGLLRGAWLHPERAQPNFLTYNSAIAACCRHGRVFRAIRLQHEMESRGIQPDVHTYTALIGGCAQARQPEMAAHLVDQMIDRGVMPTVWTYNAALKVDCYAGDFEQALQALQGMMAHPDTQPNQATWHVVLSAAQLNHRQDVVHEVLRLQQRAETASPPPERSLLSTGAISTAGPAATEMPLSQTQRAPAADGSDSSGASLEDKGYSSGSESTQRAPAAGASDSSGASSGDEGYSSGFESSDDDDMLGGNF